MLPIIWKNANRLCHVHIQFGLDLHAVQKLSSPASVSFFWWAELVQALEAFFTADLSLPVGAVSYSVHPRVASHIDPLSDTPWALRRWENERMMARKENHERLRAQATRAVEEGRLEEFLEELASDSE